MSAKWTADDIPDQRGKVIIITGANSGLGLESTKALAAKNATIVMACRNLDKAEKAKDSILAQQPDADLQVMELDNASLASIRTFTENFKGTHSRLDLLMNNAGVMAIPRSETQDGFEMQFGVNHLGHFALTLQLVDIMRETTNARIHCTSSSAAFSASINFDDLMGKENYSRWRAYSQSKLANALFAIELNRRLQNNGYPVIANSSHPGLVMTNLQQNSLESSGSPSAEKFAYRFAAPLFAQKPTMGVLPQLYASVSAEAEGGKFYGPKTLRMRGYPAAQKCNAALDNQSIRDRLWTVSAELTEIDSFYK